MIEIVKMKNESWLSESNSDWFHCEDRQEKLELLVALRFDQPILKEERNSPIKRPLDLKEEQLDEVASKRCKME